MGALSSKLRSIEGDRIGFFCPGCEEMHVVVVKGDRAWGYNGDPERPTFSPSILVTYDHWVPPATSENMNPGPQTQVHDVCHSFVKDGGIQFLSDCTHKLKDQSVPLPDYPGYESKPDPQPHGGVPTDSFQCGQQ